MSGANARGDAAAPTSHSWILFSPVLRRVSLMSSLVFVLFLVAIPFLHHARGDVAAPTSPPWVLFTPGLQCLIK